MNSYHENYPLNSTNHSPPVYYNSPRDHVWYSKLTTPSTFICRYYYDKNIILKTAGKRYVYRFVCDLQGLLGYSPEEIHQMVDLKLEKKDED